MVCTSKTLWQKGRFSFDSKAQGLSKKCEQRHGFSAQKSACSSLDKNTGAGLTTTARAGFGRSLFTLGTLAALALWPLSNVWAHSDTTAASQLRAEKAKVGALAGKEWRERHEQQVIDEFSQLLSLPNFAGNPDDIQRNAEFIVDLLAQHQIPARILEAPPARPAVYAEILHPEATRTVTFYAHYDGQPTDDSAWTSPPFEPVMRSAAIEDGGELVDWRAAQPPYDPDWRIFARSAGDNKAPIITFISAIESLRAQNLLPAMNIKLFFEGEEEIGSPHLKHMVETHSELLDADLWLFLDGPIDQRGTQNVVFGVRGVTGVDVTLYGPERGLHSGHYGNFAPNPIARMTQLLNSMRDAEGNILIAGFTDEVREPSAQALEYMAKSPSKDEWLRDDIGIAQQEKAGERYELSVMRPALNFKGFQAGQVGEQARNVVLPMATASIGFRLVPNQSTAHIRETVEAHIRAQGYRIVREDPTADQRRSHDRWAKVTWEASGYGAAGTPVDHASARALIDIMDSVTGGHLLVNPSLGGSLPLAHIQDTLDVPIALLPIANHDDNQHAPDENLRLGNLWHGIESYAAVLHALDW
jgi:acetylornithine deacetylase/succinyl-diaminopimelate desuccinylase-like protein